MWEDIGKLYAPCSQTIILLQVSLTCAVIMIIILLMPSRMEYIASKGEFVDLPKDLAPPSDPGFCMNCTRTKAAEARAFPHFSQDGFELHGVSYHPYDFVQFKTGNVTCGLGQIIPLRQEALDRRDLQIKVRLLGRLSDVTGKPKGTLKDEVGYQIVVVSRH